MTLLIQNKQHSTKLWIGVALFSFVVGLAIGNGITTQEAVRSLWDRVGYCQQVNTHLKNVINAPSTNIQQR